MRRLPKRAAPEWCRSGMMPATGGTPDWLIGQRQEPPPEDASQPATEHHLSGGQGRSKLVQAQQQSEGG